MAQLTMNFEASLVTSYATCRDYVAARVHQIGKTQKEIAADMDLSPSQLSRKLAQGDADSARFTLDDLENYVRVTGDIEPVLYLAGKYVASRAPDELRRQIAELQKRLNEVEA